MSNDIQDFLKQVAIESGEVDATPVDDITLSDVLAEEHVVGQAGASGVIQHAEKAEYIASQLDELAERAEELADEDRSYSEKAISVESLHREYMTIMRAHDINIPASSFESARSDDDRLKGITSDCRRAAKVARGYSESTLDFSAEGKILQFLRGDAMKLDKANSALSKAATVLRAASDDVKAGAVGIRHEGIATFTRQEGKQVNDLSKAVAKDVAYLDHLGKYINDSYKVIMDAAHAAATGSQGISKAQSMRLPSDSGVMTGHAHLLGDRTVVQQKEHDSKLVVGKYAYEKGGNVRGANVGGMVLSGIGSYIGWSILGGLAVGAALMVVPGAAVAVAGSAAASSAISSGVKGLVGYKTASAVINSHDRHQNASGRTSAAGYNDLIHCIDQIRSIGKYLDLKIDDDAFDTAIKAAGKAELSSAEEKTEMKKLISDLKQSMANLVRLADVAYEHAFYLTVSMASVAEQVARKSKK